MEQVRSRRGRLDLYIEITKRLAGGPVTITELGVAAKLNFASTREILDFLLAKGIVRQTVEEGRAKKYGLTKKGYEFVHGWEDALKVLYGEPTTAVKVWMPEQYNPEHVSRQRGA